MSKLFTPYKIGPIELRNRTIRSAAVQVSVRRRSCSITTLQLRVVVSE